MANINMNDFYQGYSDEEIEMIKKIIEEALKDVNESNMLDVANKLSLIKYNKYPEIQYYRVNLLIRAGRINKAYKVATNYRKFNPLVVIANELNAKIISLEPKKIEMINNIVNKFISLCDEVDFNVAFDEIKDLDYEDVVDLNKYLDDIIKIDDDKKLLDYLKTPDANRFIFLQYLRIRILLRNGSESKALNLLKPLVNKPLFAYLVNGKKKKEVKFKKEEVKIEVVPQEVKKEETKEIEDTIPSQEIKDGSQSEEVNVQEVKIEEVKSQEDVKDIEIIESSEEIKENSNDDESIIHSEQAKIMQVLLSKIYVDNIQLEEIENVEIDEFKKTILKLLYYEKYSRKSGLIFIKEQIKKYKSINGKSELKKLNKLLERFMGKPKMFDLNIYQTILGVQIRFSELDRYRKQEVKEEKEVKVVEKPREEKKVKEEVKPKKEVKYVTSSSVSIVPQTVKKALNAKLEKKPKKVTIKDALYDAVIEVEYVIYKEMHNPERQAKAIKAWDIFESMVSKSIDDEEALEKVVNFLSRIDAENLPEYKEGIKIPAGYKKYCK